LRSGTVATTSADDTISYAAALTSVTSMKVDQASCDLFAIANVIHTSIQRPSSLMSMLARLAFSIVSTSALLLSFQLF
jgi:hypothetical protein